jgi:hypothetical protein
LNVRVSEDEATRRPEYSATWRVGSETLDLASLRAALGEPTSGHDQGDFVSPGRSDARRATSAWLLDSGLPRTAPLEAHVEALLSQAESRREALARIRPDVTTDFFCGAFRNDQWVAAEDGGTIVYRCDFTLDPDAMRRLADLDMPFGCDITSRTRTIAVRHEWSRRRRCRD